MMPAAKRRKVATPEAKDRSSTARAITAYANVSKSYVASKSIQDKSDRLTTTQVVPSPRLDRKRKLQYPNEDKSDGEVNQTLAILRATLNQPQQDIKHSSQRCSIQYTPKRSRPTPSVSSLLDTPAKGAQGLFDKLLLSSSSKTQKSSPLPTQRSIGTDITLSIGQPVIEDQEALPAELIDLINLFLSFLTALTLYHAHNGPHSPADLRMLCPDIARAWGKRKILQADVQRVLGVLNTASSRNEKPHEEASAQINLSNYGHGKICVEVKRRASRNRNTAGPLDEKNLNNTFMANLRALWREHQNMGCDSISTFIEELPQESITTCSSLTKISPMLAKGQRRLEDLRTGITVKEQDEREKAITASAWNEKAPNMSLLERIKAKQTHLAKLPPPPSKEDLDRKAALHRLVEVIAILTVLTTSTSIGQERVSFTLATVLGKLKDSFRTPISKEEGETCVRLLARDIAPEWLRIVKLGKFDAIVVTRKSRPSDLDIQDRIKRAV